MNEQSGKISLVGAIAIIIGTVIGASIFILLGPVAGQAGPALYLAYMIAFIPAFFGSIYYAQLGAAMPTTGGSYFYSKRLLSAKAGYMVVMSLILGGIGAIVMLSLGFAEYLQFFFPNLNIQLTAAGIVLVLLAINLLGLKTAEIFQILMTLWILLALLVFIVPGLFAVDTQNLTPMFPNGFGGLMMGSVLAVYSYVGYGIISEIGGNIKDPTKNVPKAIFISLGIIAVVYAFVCFVAIGVIPWDTLANSGASVAEAAQVFLPSSVIFFISIGALFATATTIHAVLMTVPGDFIALSNEGIFNKKLHSKTVNGTPVVPIAFMSVLAIIGIFSGLSVVYFTTITIVGLLFNAVVIGIAAWHLPKKEKALYEAAPFRVKPGLLKLTVILGVISNIVFITLALLDAPSIILIFVLWVGLGFLLHRNRIPKNEVVMESEKSIS
ncbi:APC family permease [Oceanobacillus sp. CAU 1775]